MNCPRCGNQSIRYFRSGYGCRFCLLTWLDDEQDMRLWGVRLETVAAAAFPRGAMPRPAPATTKPQQWPVWPWRCRLLAEHFEKCDELWFLQYQGVQYLRDLRKQSDDFVEAELRRAGWLDAVVER